MSAALDYAVGGEAAYTGLEGDSSDARAMQPFAADQSAPWWQSLVAYGVTRAIDNRFAPPNVTGNTSPGSFAGANGRTYSQAPQASGGGAMLAGSGVPSWLLIAGAAVVAFLLIRR